MPGKYYDEFEIGQCTVHDVRRTVTEMDNFFHGVDAQHAAASFGRRGRQGH